jgi:hypothetical protein
MSANNKISWTDIKDADLYDSYELKSDGTETYFSTTISTCVSSTKTITIPNDINVYLINGDTPIDIGDIVRITGNAAAGTYTVATVVGDFSFTVNENIADASGGTVEFRYDAGAKLIGVDPTGLSYISVADNNVQKAITAIDSAIASLPVVDKRQLIYLADGVGGPFEDFPSGTYREITGDLFPTSVVWYESNTKAKKIVETSISYNGNKTINTVVWKNYASDGTTIINTITDTMTYNGIFETSRTRTIA